MDLLPARSYWVAAAGYTGVELLVAVWEVTMSPGGVLDVGRQDLLSEIRFAPPSANARIYALSFLGDSCAVMALASGGGLEASSQFIWDVRTGAELRRLERTIATAVSPNGKMVIGNFEAPGGHEPNVAALVDVGAGEVIRPVPPGDGDLGRKCAGAVFSPAGDDAAVMLVNPNDPGNIFRRTLRTSLELWAIPAGEVRCRADDVWGSPGKLAYDGSRIVLCRGRSIPAAAYLVRRIAEGCELVPDPAPPPSCDHASLPGGLFLRVAGQNATVEVGGGGVAHTLLPAAGALISHGMFSPGGGCVLLGNKELGVLDPEAHPVIWRLAGGRGPRVVDEGLEQDPAFSSDGTAAAGLRKGRREVVFMDLEGGGPPLSLRLRPELQFTTVGVSARRPV